MIIPRPSATPLKSITGPLKENRPLPTRLRFQPRSVWAQCLSNLCTQANSPLLFQSIWAIGWRHGATHQRVFTCDVRKARRVNDKVCFMREGSSLKTRFWRRRSFGRRGLRNNIIKFNNFPPLKSLIPAIMEITEAALGNRGGKGRESVYSRHDFVASTLLLPVYGSGCGLIYNFDQSGYGLKHWLDHSQTTKLLHVNTVVLDARVTVFCIESKRY